ncbi:bifunctional glycosyltransferase family 2/GtrA family protein [Lactiplantibacillus modestisalitolerans]|uniref:Glycosyltransferase n=1 Tax=Lactiplantibacillus modestisalitolerans TaxID=1457219 RepID=A0ABV5WTI5_9LACO|nr:bifunctional glycosyltransferase family 2/GtrA family protein [Lactiplantibacillus modestisalitolerans]
MTNIGIVIPALNPDERLIQLIKELAQTPLKTAPIVIVDDGSDAAHQPYFNQLIHLTPALTILHHAANRGKGAALKTAFTYLQTNAPDLTGIATLDADGQHTVGALHACVEKFAQTPTALVLGVRQFTTAIPWRSQFGNRVTRTLTRLVTRQHISDTQTGLRIIPQAYLAPLCQLPGERFEYEFNMLLRARHYHVQIVEQPIPTIYIDGNRSSHFRVVRDSIAIYAQFIKFTMSDLLSFCVDIACFQLTLVLLGQHDLTNILVATISSRLLSGIVNYGLNRQVVFNGAGRQTLIKYAALFCVQMIASGLLTDGVTALFGPNSPAVVPLIAKMAVDLGLFLVSYQVQRRLIFKKDPQYDHYPL